MVEFRPDMQTVRGRRSHWFRSDDWPSQNFHARSGLRGNRHFWIVSVGYNPSRMDGGAV